MSGAAGGSLFAANIYAQAIATVGNIYADYQLSQGQQALNEAQSAFYRSQAEINARFAEMQAEFTLKQGTKAARQYQKQVSQVVGEQRAQMAAQGIDVNTGSAADIQQETAEIGALDAMTIKNNAWRQAFGFQQEALNLRFEGRIAAITGNFQSNQASFQRRANVVSGVQSLIGLGLGGAAEYQRSYA